MIQPLCRRLARSCGWGAIILCAAWGDAAWAAPAVAITPAPTAVLRSDGLSVDVSDRGHLIDIWADAELGSAAVNAVAERREPGGWYLGSERLQIASSSIRRSSSRFGAELAGGVSGALAYSLEGSLLEVELNVSREMSLAGLRFELPSASVRLHEETVFVGMASYLNGSLAIEISGEGELESLVLPYRFDGLSSRQWIGRKSRYFALLVRAPGAVIDVAEDGSVVASWSEPVSRPSLQLFLGKLNAATQQISDLPRSLQYANLWWPFRILCFGVEWVLLALYRGIGSWGLAIIASSLALRVVMIPINRKVAQYQREVNSNLTALEPRLLEIKQKYTGAKASEAILAAHSDLGISPFHTVKPTLGLMIQIPVLIAIFNVFGDLEAVRGHGFLWIDDLSYPDTIARLPFSIPMIGDGLNLLPILMTAINLLSAFLLSPPGLPASQLRSQRRGLYLMAATFFVLFYAFPASMVLLWTTSNLLQLVNQSISQRKQAPTQMIAPK